MTEKEYRDLQWHGLPRPETMGDQLAAIASAWGGGIWCRGDIDALYFDVVVFEGVDFEGMQAVLALIPEEFRRRVAQDLKDLAVYDSTRIRIMGGIYAYEVQHDPVKRATMKAELEAQQAGEDEVFALTVRPRVKAWHAGV